MKFQQKSKENKNLSIEKTNKTKGSKKKKIAIKIILDKMWRSYQHGSALMHLSPFATNNI